MSRWILLWLRWAAAEAPEQMSQVWSCAFAFHGPWTLLSTELLNLHTSLSPVHSRSRSPPVLITFRSDKSPLGQDEFPLVHNRRPLSNTVEKSQQQELGATCHFASTVKKQRETDACSYLKVSILHSPGPRLAQGMVPPPVGGSSHFHNLVKIGPL